MEPTADLAAWLRRKMGEYEWNQSDLGRRIGVRPSLVSKWLSGQAKPSPASIDRLADVFRVDVDRLLTMAGHRPAGLDREIEPERAELLAKVDRLVLTPDRVFFLRGAFDAMLKADALARQREREQNGSA